MVETVFTDFEIELPDEPGVSMPPPIEGTGGPLAVQYMTPVVARRLRGCTACTCRPEAQQVVVGTGAADARILFLGQNPGDDEDAEGAPLVGRAGKELNTWLFGLRIARSRVAVSNIVKCHTAKNRKPKTGEVVTCRDLWFPAELDLLPAVQLVVPLGKPATEALLGVGAKPPHPKAIYWRAANWRDRPFIIYPLPHPAHLLRTQMLRAFFLTTVLPRILTCWQTEWPEVYQHAMLTAEDMKGAE